MKLSTAILSLIAIVFVESSQHVGETPPPSVFAVKTGRTHVKRAELSLSDKTKAAIAKTPVPEAPALQSKNVAPSTGHQIAKTSPFAVHEVNPVKQVEVHHEQPRHDTFDLHKGATETHETIKPSEHQALKEELTELLQSELANLPQAAPIHAVEHREVLKGEMYEKEHPSATAHVASTTPISQVSATPTIASHQQVHQIIEKKSNEPLKACKEPVPIIPSDGYLPTAIEGVPDSETLANAIYHDLEQLRQRYTPSLLSENIRYREAVIAANERKSRVHSIYADKNDDDKEMHQLRNLLKTYDELLLQRDGDLKQFEHCKDQWIKHELGDGPLYNDHERRQRVKPTKLYPINLPVAFEAEPGTELTLKALQDADFFLNHPFLPNSTQIGPRSDLGNIFERANDRHQKNEYEQQQHTSPRMKEMQRELRQADEMVVNRFKLMKELAKEEAKKIRKASGYAS